MGGENEQKTHLMSVQIDDGRRGHALHPLEEELTGSGKILLRQEVGIFSLFIVVVVVVVVIVVIVVVDSFNVPKGQFVSQTAVGINNK